MLGSSVSGGRSRYVNESWVAASMYIVRVTLRTKLLRPPVGCSTLVPGRWLHGRCATSARCAPPPAGPPHDQERAGEAGRSAPAQQLIAGILQQQQRAVDGPVGEPLRVVRVVGALNGLEALVHGVDNADRVAAVGGWVVGVHGCMWGARTGAEHACATQRRRRVCTRTAWGCMWVWGHVHMIADRAARRRPDPSCAPMLRRAWREAGGGGGVLLCAARMPFSPWRGGYLR